MKRPSVVSAGAEHVTFAPMIDSELARLLLRYYGVDFVERDHLFGWASVVAVSRGGYGRIPLLHNGVLRLSGPPAIVDHYDPLQPVDRRLLPATQTARSQIDADWERYNGYLANDVAQATCQKPSAD